MSFHFDPEKGLIVVPTKLMVLWKDIDGVLGLDLFQDQKLLIDFPKCKIIID